MDSDPRQCDRGQAAPGRCLILANPRAGGLTKRELLTEIPERIMRRLHRRKVEETEEPITPPALSMLAELAASVGLEATIELAPPPSELPALIRKAHREGYDTIVAVGGDGTVRSVAQGMIHSPLRLGILPMGTANNVARSLGIPFQPEAAIAALANGVERQIDVGWIGNEFFLEGAGVGLFADAIKAFGASEPRIYQLRRLGSVIGPLLWNLHSRTLQLSLDNIVEQDEAILVIVANGPYIGEGYALAPDASLDDGLFDVVIVGALNRMELIRFALAFLHGRHLSLPKVRRLQAQTVHIQRVHRAHRALPVHADDHIAAYTPIRIDVLPRALRVIAPPQGN